MTRLIMTISATMGSFFRMVIFIYQYTISPFIPAACRYWPSCSEYASQAIDMYGPLGGGWISLKRLMRCHPWSGHGYDPVPINTKSVCCGHHYAKVKYDHRTANK